PLHASGNAIWDFDSTEDVRKDNTNNNRQSEMQELRSRIAEERNGVDSIGIQEIWMGDQREQEQVETGVTVCVPGMDVQFNNNEDLTDQREKEGIESINTKINQVNNGINSIKDQKRGKFGWQAQVFHSIIQTRRTASIANKQINEQSIKSNGLDKRNDSNKELFNRTILVDDIIGEQQAKDD
ncbi:MAG: hypothetical protein EZS28_032511, partial [Streblomastix strix]